MVRAWLKDDSDEEPQKPHQRTPNVEVSLEELAKMGVTYKRMNIEKYEEGGRYQEDPEFQYYITHKEFQFSDILDLSNPDAQPEKTLQCFYREHFHQDDEIRYIIEGSCFYDFRNQKDEWVRVLLEKGDLIFTPAGLYHRFALDENRCQKSIRLFVADALWQPVYRPADDHFIRKKYLKKYGAS